jgi:hypothetical protein
MKTYHHNSNDYLLSNSVNVFYEDLIKMDEEEFRSWCLDFREEVKSSWLNHNQPPVKTIDDESIVRQMERLADLSLDNTLQVDTMTNTRDCIVMKSPIHCGNSFFPNMSKMKDINTTDMQGESLWDYFIEGRKTDQFVQSLKRNFKLDSFYTFAPTLTKDVLLSNGQTDAFQWISQFNDTCSDEYGFWLEPIQKSQRGLISIRGTEVMDLKELGKVTDANFNSYSEPLSVKDIFRIRVYKKKQKVLNIGLNFLKKGLVMMGVNFPPTIAKWIYTTFTDDLKDQEKIIIYDPSMGYGGRLLGSLSVNNDRRIHYIGTDPNTDNWLPELGISRYEYMGRFFNSNVRRRFETTYEMFMEGSEVVHKNPDFQKYRGKVDFIFTSPPYFGAEGYCEDETQSYKKFPTYEEWRDGFLKQTLKNCVEWLKPGRWMCWNISDVQFNGKYYPLERDSVEMMKSLGMEYRNRYKMVLSGPVQKKNVKKHTRLPSTKNFCGLRGNFKKYEPIFCFYKPTGD